MKRGTAVALATGILFLAGCSGSSEEPPTRSVSTDEEANGPELPEPIPVGDAEVVKLSERLVREVPIADGPDWMVSGFDSLWVKLDNGDVVRVDPADGDLDDTISSGPFQPPVCQGLGISEDSIWSCPQERIIDRIDPRKASIVDSIKIDKQPEQGRLVSAGDNLWVLTDSGEKLTPIGLTSGDPGKSLDLGGEGGACTDLAGGGAELWVLCPIDGRVVRVDPSVPEVTGELELPDASVASAGEDLWVGFEGGLAQIDPDALEVLAVYEVNPTFGGSVYATEDAVWVREAGGHFLTRVDPVDGEVVETIEAPELPSGGDVIESEGSLWATAYDDNTLVQLRLPEP